MLKTNLSTSSLRPQAQGTTLGEQPDASATLPAAASVTLRPSPSPPKPLAWLRTLGAGIRLDIHARAPWYINDWTDAWNYRVVPATALIFFAKYAPNSRDVESTKPFCLLAFFQALPFHWIL